MHINKWRLFWIHYGVVVLFLMIWDPNIDLSVFNPSSSTLWYDLKWLLFFSPWAPFPNAFWPTFFGTTFYLFVFQDLVDKKYKFFFLKLLLFVFLLVGCNLFMRSTYHWLQSNYLYSYFGKDFENEARANGKLFQSFFSIFIEESRTFFQIREDYNSTNFLGTNLLYTAFFTLIMYVWQSRKREEELEKQQREVEIQSLKAQLNPHFLFNSLNTIYSSALTEKDTPTAQLVQQLSGILRHSVDEIRHEKTSLEKELAFIEKYLALQRARLPQHPHVSINTSIHWDQEPADIAPLLLIPFIENAFQYGISLDQPSFVAIHLEIEDKKLHLHVENSLLTIIHSHQKGVGTGLPNVQKRLALLYPHQHTLRFGSEGSTFLVDLTLQL